MYAPQSHEQRNLGPRPEDHACEEASIQATESALQRAQPGPQVEVFGLKALWDLAVQDVRPPGLADSS